MQKRVADLRSNAFSNGLHVKLPVSLSFPAICIKSEHAYYCKLRKLKPTQPFVHLLRDINSNIQVTPAKKSEQNKALEKILAGMPFEYSALYIGNDLIGVSWDEMGADSIPDELLSTLKKIENLLFG